VSLRKAGTNIVGHCKSFVFVQPFHFYAQIALLRTFDYAVVDPLSTMMTSKFLYVSFLRASKQRNKCVALFQEIMITDTEGCNIHIPVGETNNII
jgi:hypothetical protein